MFPVMDSFIILFQLYYIPMSFVIRKGNIGDDVEMCVKMNY